MRTFLRFFACLSFTFGSLATNAFLTTSAKSSNLGPAPVANNSEKKGPSTKNSGAVSKAASKDAKNNANSEVSSKVKVDQSKSTSTSVTTSLDQENKSDNTKNNGNADQNSKNKKVDSRDSSGKNTAPESNSVTKKSALKNGSKVKSSNSSKGSLNTGAKLGEAKLEDEGTAPESWSVENKTEEPVSNEGNFSAIQNSSTEDKSLDKAKWLFYSGIGLIVFSLIGLAFFALFLVRNNRKLHSGVESDPDEDDDY